MFDFQNGKFISQVKGQTIEEFIPSQTERTFLDLLGEWMLITSQDGVIVYANSRADRTFAGKIIGQRLSEAFNIPIKMSNIKKVLSCGIAINGAVQRYRLTEDGPWRASVSNTYPVIAGGVIIGAVEIGEDLTGYNHISQDIVDMLPDRIQNKVPKTKSALYKINDIVGESKSIRSLKSQIVLASKTNHSILLYGETGTGKELVAQAIHSLSPRKGGFVAQNCAAIPESLFEGVLFGTRRGAFTGAEDRAGLFEVASGGSLFLDELNSMPLTHQAKILRVLEQHKLRQVGGSAEIAIDLKLIAALNQDPAKLMREGRLREDLYYRLNVFKIEIPPLRERTEDIALIVNSWLAEDEGRVPARITACALEKLESYDWPGNVRELRNIIDRALIISEDRVICRETIKLETVAPSGQLTDARPVFSPLFRQDLEMQERERLIQAVEMAGGNISRAAKYLGIPQQTLDSKLSRFALKAEVTELKKRRHIAKTTP
jgi:arginine utilization regulatory protein